MQRYFIKKHHIQDQIITVDHADDIHHIKNVMRMQPGQTIICTVSPEEAYLCTIKEISSESVITSIDKRLENNTELPVDVTIFQGLPKKNKLELIVQKGTELGGNQFGLFQADRSIVKWDKKKTAQKVDRLERIAQEASEQSGRGRVPVIQEYETLKQICQQQDQYDLLLFAYEEEAKTQDYHSLASALKDCHRGHCIGIFIGPEGGFSNDEVSLFKHYGIQSVRLGARILRTETASMYALASISYHFEEMI